MRLLSVVVKFGLVVAVVVGGVYVYENWDTADSGSRPAPIDYNCGLPGCGSPWLRELGSTCWSHGLSAAPWPPPADAVDCGLVDRKAADEKGCVRCTPGIDVPFPGWFWVAPYWGPGAYSQVYVPIDDRSESGFTRNWREVYAALCAVHPQLGGSGLTRISSDDRDDYGISEGPWYAGSGTVANGKDNIYLLPALSPETLDYMTGDDTGACGASQANTAPTPTRRESPTSAPKATPTPAPTGETRRYRVTVNGYENALPWPVPDGPLRAGVRFDYRLIGEFVLERPTASKPWAVTSRRVVTADLKYKSLYPADRCQVTLKCQPGGQGRACRQLHKVTTLRLRVRVDGDEIIVSWGAFKPQLEAAGTCTDPSRVIGTSYEADQFQKEIGGERMPLQDTYAGPEKTKLYQGHNVVSTSFTYGLERLP